VVRGDHVGAAAAATAAAATGDDGADHLAAVRALFVGSDASAAAAVPRHWRSMCVSCSRSSRTARVFLYHLHAPSTTQTEILPT
jgi:hypothetical protein